MTTKRDRSSIEDSETTDDSKRPRVANGRAHKKQTLEPTTDVTYGQRSCFPGLENPNAAQHSDEDLEFEDETDALAYLQSVRQQASAIPHLLVAPKAGPQLPSRRPIAHEDDDDDNQLDYSIYTNGKGDTRGYYEDGAYTAAPNPPSSSLSTQDPVDSDSARLTAAYFASLAAAFTALRAQLHQAPPPAAVAALSTNHSPHVPRFGPNSSTHSIWAARLCDFDPAPAQVASMDKGSVLRVLRVLLGGRHFLRTGETLAERTSRWLWALLARLPDRGELDHTETGYVRELGKRAALMMCGLREMALLREEVELEGHRTDAEGGDDEVWLGAEDEDEDEENIRDNPTRPDKENENDDIEDGEITDSAPMDIDTDAEAETENHLETARARLLATLDDTASGSGDAQQQEPEEAFDPVRARLNTRATLNMILTVAGEFYGQRDLLEFRDPFRGV